MDYTLYRAEEFAADESFVLYFQRANEEAVLFWEQWISLHPEKMDEVMLAEQMLGRLIGYLPVEEFETEQARMLDFLEQSPATPGTVVVRKKRMNTWLIAAGVAVLAVLTYIWLTPRQPQPLAWVLYKNQPATRTSIDLPDGSTVTLNAAASIYYAYSEKKDSLQVILDGEAYFKIAPNNRRAFTVKGGEMQIVVLGTAFNMSYYPETGKSEVALVQGKLKVQAGAAPSLVLHPNQMAGFDAGAGVLSTGSFNEAEMLGWQENKLYFNRASFETIAQKLKRLYNINIINQSTVTNMQYTGHFENTGYRQVLESICFSHHLAYKVMGDSVFVFNK